MKLTPKEMILISTFAALTAIGAFISFYIPPFPVKFTLQFFFCAFAGMLLGARNGMLSQLLYVLIGLAGVPIFTEGGGIGYIFNKSFGYLIGFILSAYVIGKLTEKVKKKNILTLYCIVVLGLMVTYVVGVPYLYLIINLYLNKTMAFSAAIKAGFLVFLPKDLFMSFIVASISLVVMPRIKRFI